MDHLGFYFQFGILCFNLGTLAGMMLAYLILGNCHRKRRARNAQDARGRRRTTLDPSDSPTRER